MNLGNMEEGSFSDDDVSYLLTKALYVSPARRHIDMSTVPSDGNEYILKSRLEDSLLEFPAWEDSSVQSDKCESDDKQRSTNIKTLSELNQEFIKTRFYPLAQCIKKNDKILFKNFPSKESIPLKDVILCCEFCLGSEMCSVIYPETVNCSNTAKPHLPLLSYVIHLKKGQLYTLISNINIWFIQIGMTDLISLWFFAAFACLKKPLSDREHELLEDIYDHCVQLLKKSEDSELIRLHLIYSILKHYYCIKDHAIFPNFGMD